MRSWCCRFALPYNMGAHLMLKHRPGLSHKASYPRRARLRIEQFSRRTGGIVDW
jgi:hypothetical protein